MKSDNNIDQTIHAILKLIQPRKKLLYSNITKNSRFSKIGSDTKNFKLQGTKYLKTANEIKLQ